MRCVISGCGGERFSGELCSRHYNRKRTTGTTDDGPRARLPLEDRLWKKIEQRGPLECWPWIGKSKIDGYGHISRGGVRGGSILAHRAVWESVHGPIPNGSGYHGTVIRHECNNRACCNPAHLQVGTQADNVRDMDSQGRRVVSVKRGSQHPNARFTEADIRYMRASPKSAAEMAAEYGIHRGTVGTIRARRSWKHIK